mgnify:CR=1 FL=1
MFDNIKKELYFFRKEVLFNKGIKEGKIVPFDDCFYEKMSHTYFNCVPISMHIKYLKPLSGPGKCYDRSLFMFFCFDDALLVRADIKNLELLYGKENAGHGWIEIDDYVYDPSSTLRFDKKLYYQIYNPTNGNPTNLPFSLTVKASDPESGIDYWYYSYDEENWIKYDDPAYDSYEKDEYLTSPFSTERNEDVYIKVCNKAGLCGVNSTRINIDTTPPGCTITPNGTEKDGYYTTNVRFDLSPDAGTIKYLITSTQQNMASMTQASFDNQLQKTMTTDTNGTSWYGYIMDPAGNIGECKSRPVKRDTTPPPQPQITNPTGGNWTKDPFSLTVKSTDSNSGNGYWYYSYDTTPDDSKNWEIYNESGYNSLGKTEFVTSPFSRCFSKIRS